ncbi:MAG: ABC transporter permease subunit, partial [Eubacterium sp.]
MNILISKPDEKTPPLKIAFNVLLLSVIFIGIFWFSLSQIGVSLDFAFLGDFRAAIVKGFLMTVFLSLASLVVSLSIGLLSAVGQGSKLLLLRYLSRAYVTFIRGTPLIMQIYL